MTKTVKVDLIKEIGNRMLVDSPNDAAEYRNGVIILVTQILMETRNYRGFRYLSENDVEQGYTVGVHLDNPERVHCFEDTDRTRVQIY